MLSFEPKLLLLDEPTSALDEISRNCVEEFILNSNITCLWVTHDKNLENRVKAEIFTFPQSL